MEYNKRGIYLEYHTFNSYAFLLCSHQYEWILSRRRGLHRTIVTIHL